MENGCNGVHPALPCSLRVPPSSSPLRPGHTPHHNSHTSSDRASCLTAVCWLLPCRRGKLLSFHSPRRRPATTVAAAALLPLPPSCFSFPTHACAHAHANKKTRTRSSGVIFANSSTVPFESVEPQTMAYNHRTVKQQGSSIPIEAAPKRSLRSLPLPSGWAAGGPPKSSDAKPTSSCCRHQSHANTGPRGTDAHRGHGRSKESLDSNSRPT